MKKTLNILPVLLLLALLGAGTALAADQAAMPSMPGMEMPASNGGSDASRMHDHSKHKVKVPVYKPTKESVVEIGSRTGDVERGRRLFESNCVFCHGRRGLGDGPIVIGLDAAPPPYFREGGILYMTDQEIFNVVSYGTITSEQIEMPAWVLSLTEDERLDAIAYVKELAARTRDEMKATGEYEKYAKIGAGGGKLALHDHGTGHEMFHIHGADHMGGDMMLMKGMAPVSPPVMAAVFAVLTALTLALLYLFDRRGAGLDRSGYARLDLLRSGIFKRIFKARPFQFVFQLPVVLLFVLVIVAGLVGDQNPGRNFSTVATWTVWWAGVMFVILLLGAGWCFVCPWSAMSDWIERVSFWKRRRGISRALKWPRPLRSRHTMTVFFILVTWMELGIFITYKPRLTSVFAFLMFALILITALLYERKTFCRYICFMGGIIGMYSNQAPLEVRSRDKSVCEGCKTKDCMRGNERGYPCPIFEYPGGMDQNTNCILCTECMKTCPHDNMTLNVRPFFTDFSRGYKGRFDEAFLAMTLLGLTIYHGFTMLPLWFGWAIETIKVDYTLYISVFTLLLAAFVLVPVGIHYAVSWLTRLLSGGRAADGSAVSVRDIFVQYSYAFLPVAFFYHLAHNISHLNMEGLKILPVLSDPFGRGWDIFGTAGSKASMLLSMSTTRDIQFLFIIIGLVVGLLLSYRFSLRMFGERGRALVAMLPMAAAVLAYSYVDMLALVLPMVMRTVSYF